MPLFSGVDSIANPTVTFQVLSRIPHAAYDRFREPPLLVPYYHMVSDETIAHVRHLFPYKTIRQFKSDLAFLLKKYKPLGLAEVIKHIRDARPFPPRTFLLTFDDGYREMSEVVAPILLDEGVSATFFVNSAFVDNRQLGHCNKQSVVIDQFERRRTAALEAKALEVLHSHGIRSSDFASGIKNVSTIQGYIVDEVASLLEIDWTAYLRVCRPYLTSAQIHQLIKGGFTVGGHSIDHTSYSSLSLEGQLEQTMESVRSVREKFGLDYGAFAFPFSDDDVSREFFARMFHSRVVDVSFGTAGMVRGWERKHIQRTWFEAPIATAERIIAFQYARYVMKLIRAKVSGIIPQRCS